MAQQTKIVTILPQEAAAAGCSATCTSYVENKTREVTLSGGDKAYRTFTNYYIEAFPAGLWKFKNFVATVTYSDTSGASHTYEQTWTPPNSGTIYPTSLHTDYETDPTDYTSVEPAGKHIDAQPTRSFSNVRAVFEFNGWRITTSVSPVGGGTTTGAGTYAAESSCTLTATPAAGYTFVRWEKNGSQVSTNASYTFTVSESATYTAVFATGVTVTLVATSFGRVRFEGDPAVHGTVSKSFAPGELVTIEAVTEYGSIFKQWRESYSGTVLTNARLIIFANDYIWTATFYHLYTVHARLAADIDTPCPNGQVRVVATETTTAWGRDVRYEKIDIQTLTIEQQSTGGGWAFVKWRYYSRYYERWYESTDATLRLVNYGYDIYALFQRTPTHLLVNSSTVESPAKLVYDPATNKLVADY